MYLKKLKNFVPVLLLFFMLVGCSLPNSTSSNGLGDIEAGAKGALESDVLNPELLPDKISESEPTFSELKKGPFIGGSLIYSSTNPELSHLRTGMTIPFRLGEVQEQYDKELAEYVLTDMPDRAKYGFMVINFVSDASISVRFKIYNATGKVIATGNRILQNGVRVDIDNNGSKDLLYSPVQASRANLIRMMYLNFISSQDGRYTTMYSLMPYQCVNNRYPSGIMGVNNEGRLLLSGTGYLANSRAIGSTQKDMQITQAAASIIQDGDYVLDEQAGAFGQVTQMKTIQPGVASAILDSSSESTSQQAISLLYFEFDGTLDELENGPVPLYSGESRSGYDAKLANLYGKLSGFKKFTLLDKSFHKNIDANNGKVDINFAKLKAIIGVKATGSISWKKIEMDVKVAFLADTDTTLKIVGNFDTEIWRTRLVDYSTRFSLGPVIIKFHLPLDIGLGAAASFESEVQVGLKAAAYYGVGAGVTAGMKKLRFYSDWRSYNESEFIHDFSSNTNIDCTGTAILKPFLEISPKITLWEVLFAQVPVKAYIGPRVTSTIDNSTLTLTGSVETGGSVKVTVGYDVKLFDGSKTWNLADWNKTIWSTTLYTKTIATPLKSVYVSGPINLNRNVYGTFRIGKTPSNTTTSIKSYRWYKNGSLVSSWNDKSYVSYRSLSNFNLKCVVTDTNNKTYTTPVKYVKINTAEITPFPLITPRPLITPSPLKTPYPKDELHPLDPIVAPIER